MARITVEDCLDKIDNRFEMVLTATKRARQIADGLVDPERVDVMQAEIEAAEAFDAPIEDDDFNP